MIVWHTLGYINLQKIIIIKYWHRLYMYNIYAKLVISFYEKKKKKIFSSTNINIMSRTSSFCECVFVLWLACCHTLHDQYATPTHLVNIISISCDPRLESQYGDLSHETQSDEDRHAPCTAITTSEPRLFYAMGSLSFTLDLMTDVLQSSSPCWHVSTHQVTVAFVRQSRETRCYAQ